MTKFQQLRRVWCGFTGMFCGGSVLRRGHAIFGALLIVLMLTACVPILNAQLYTGSISGTVTDPSAAAIPSAKLTLVDADKGFSFSASADSEGRFLFRQV